MRLSTKALLIILFFFGVSGVSLMAQVPPSVEKENLRYFELAKAQAEVKECLKGVKKCKYRITYEVIRVDYFQGNPGHIVSIYKEKSRNPVGSPEKVAEAEFGQQDELKRADCGGEAGQEAPPVD